MTVRKEKSRNSITHSNETIGIEITIIAHPDAYANFVFNLFNFYTYTRNKTRLEIRSYNNCASNFLKGGKTVCIRQ